MSASSLPTTDREPCPTCGESLALAAAKCIHCGTSALVDVRLIPPVADGRVRYQLARAIAALGPPARPFPELQAALAGTATTLARGATREFARRIDGALAPYQLQADVSSVGAASGGRRTMMAGAAIAVLLLAAGAFAVARRAPRPGAAENPKASAAIPASADRALPVAQPAPVSGASLAAHVLASTVAIQCGQSLGAGFFVAEDLVMTNEHVLCPAGDRMRLALYDGQTATGDTVKADKRLDVALVRVSGARGRPLPVGDAGVLRPGDRVSLVGSPVGMEFTYHEGLVSNPARPILGVSYIQVDARVNPGNSGGPLVDGGGRVVGVVSLKRTDAEGIGLALPINYAYSPEVAMVAPPAAASAGFEGMQAQAREAEASDVRQIADMPLPPLLVGARDDAYGRMVARVVLPSRTPPVSQSFSFHFRNGNQTICPLPGVVSDWREVESSELSRSLGPRLGDFLQRHGLDVRLYAGEAPIPVGNCRGVGVFGSDLTLEMEGADERAARVRIR